ncbi:MAG: nucleotide pyrophosphohydrolase [Candidatus Hydrothermarchaeales archaeon]
MQSDRTITLSELKTEVEKFRDERDWKKFHTPKNLAVSISIEAGELLELFQWRDIAIAEVKKDAKLMQKIKGEMADIMLFLLSMANVLDIDISTATLRKLEINKERYPTEEYYGRA